MGDEVRSDPRRNDKERHPESRLIEARLKIPRLQVRLDLIRLGHGHRWHVIIHAATLVKGKDESRVSPYSAIHEGIYVLLAVLDAVIDVSTRVFVHSTAALDEHDLWEGALVLHVDEILRDREDILRIGTVS